MATFQNIYYKRTAATAKACYMCYRPTTTVLATLNTTDFIYTCDAHLTDHGFATLIEPPSDLQASTRPNTVSDEEIRRAREEWEERQRRKEKAKESDKDKEKEKEKEKEEKYSRKPSVSSPKPAPPPPAPIPVPGSTVPAKPTHQRYSLHREVFAMRLAEHRRKRQSTAVKEVAPRLPITPRGGVA